MHDQIQNQQSRWFSSHYGIGSSNRGRTEGAKSDENGPIEAHIKTRRGERCNIYTKCAIGPVDHLTKFNHASVWKRSVQDPVLQRG